VVDFFSSRNSGGGDSVFDGEFSEREGGAGESCQEFAE
jgi:hypothetical protein